jgi:hypothetical protein
VRVGEGVVEPGGERTGLGARLPAQQGLESDQGRVRLEDVRPGQQQPVDRLDEVGQAAAVHQLRAELRTGGAARPYQRHGQPYPGHAQPVAQRDPDPDVERAWLNDDRVGRALVTLFDADRASLLTELIVGVVDEFGVDTSEMHNDSTSRVCRSRRRRTTRSRAAGCRLGRGVRRSWSR